jgi:uncharacterized protein (DUF2164 family)
MLIKTEIEIHKKFDVDDFKHWPGSKEGLTLIGQYFYSQGVDDAVANCYNQLLDPEYRKTLLKYMEDHNWQKYEEL